MPQPAPTIELEAFRQSATRLLAGWAALGLLLIALWPAARGYSHWIGYWPFWLLGAPLIALLGLHRDRLLASLRHVPRRTSPTARRRRQARRAPRAARPATALRASLAALLPR
jgi:hypothetical protein